VRGIVVSIHGSIHFVPTAYHRLSVGTMCYGTDGQVNGWSACRLSVPRSAMYTR